MDVIIFLGKKYLEQTYMKKLKIYVTSIENFESNEIITQSDFTFRDRSRRTPHSIC